MNPDDVHVDLVRAGRFVRRYLVAFLVGALLGAVAFVARVDLDSVRYQARALVSTRQVFNDDDLNLDTNAVNVDERASEIAAAHPGRDLVAAQFVVLNAFSGVEVVVVASSAVLAEQRANAWAEALVATRTARLHDGYESHRRALDVTIAELERQATGAREAKRGALPKQGALPKHEGGSPTGTRAAAPGSLATVPTALEIARDDRARLGTRESVTQSSVVARRAGPRAPAHRIGVLNTRSGAAVRGGVLGLTAMIGGLLAFEFLRNRVRVPVDAQSAVPDLSVLGMVEDRPRGALAVSGPPSASWFVASRLVDTATRGCPILLTGPDPGAFAHAALALAQARAHGTTKSDTVVIDADVDDGHGPAALLGLSKRAGLVEAVHGSRDVRDLVCRRDPRTAVLAPGHGTSRELANQADSLRQVLSQASDDGAAVIVAAPSASTSALTVAYASLVGAVVLVAEVDRTRRRALRRDAQLLTSAGGHVIGVIVLGVSRHDALPIAN